MYLRQAVASHPESTCVYERLGTLLFKAFVIIREAHTSFLCNAHALFQITNSVAFRTNVDEAKSLFLHSIQLDPCNYLAHYNLSQLFKHQKQYEKQEFHLLKALEQNPKVYFSEMISCHRPR